MTQPIVQLLVYHLIEFTGSNHEHRVNVTSLTTQNLTNQSISQLTNHSIDQPINHSIISQSSN